MANTNDDTPAALDSKKNVRNLKLTIAYDGFEFAGWQVQPGRSTVQGALASAILSVPPFPFKKLRVSFGCRRPPQTPISADCVDVIQSLAGSGRHLSR